jgi:hypothetical protein
MNNADSCSCSVGTENTFFFNSCFQKKILFLIRAYKKLIEVITVLLLLYFEEQQIIIQQLAPCWNYRPSGLQTKDCPQKTMGIGVQLVTSERADSSSVTVLVSKAHSGGRTA